MGCGCQRRCAIAGPPVKIIVTSGKRKPEPDILPDGGVFMAKPYLSEKLTAAIEELLS